MPVPPRPRLTDRVVVRRHLGDEDVVVLHDHDSRHVMRILLVQWQVLALADGTRDLEGITLAARARGIQASVADVAEFLAHLADKGMLADGPTEPAEVDDPDADLLEVPLDPIEGWTFACSGRGVCCEVFPTILFTAHEASKAMVLLEDEPHDFYPQHGAPRDDGAVAPILVEGRCRYLADDRRCTLHARGGTAAKPAGCRAFPMQSVYDGERVRAAFAFECACVVDGIGATDGLPPVPEGARVLGDLPRPTRVGRLPDRVPVDGTRFADRAATRELFRALASMDAPADVARGLFALGTALAEGGLAADAYRDGPLDEAAAMAFLARLRESVSAWREPLAAFRTERDLTRLGLDWLVAAADRIAERGLPPPPAAGSSAAEIEAFYVRNACFLYRDALGTLPLATAFAVRALRVWLARAIAEAPPEDPRAAEPLTLVEVLFRAAGLDAFAAT